ISKYLANLNPDFLTLNYIEVDENGAPASIQPRATWQDGAFAPDHPTLNRVYLLSEFTAAELWTRDSDTPLIIGDITADGRLDDSARGYLKQIGSSALIIIPLYGAGRWQAMIA